MNATLPWQRLSREGRDTLWLLAALTLSLAPHLTRLPVWCSLGALAALSWRAWLAWSDRPLPPRWMLMVALIGSVGLTVWTHHTIVGREAGITLVSVLASLKTLELRARRDAFVVTALGFFLVLTQFIHSQGPLIALLMLLAVWALMTSMVLAQRPLGRPPLKEVGLATARTMLMGLPLMLMLYVLFPRVGPLWSNPSLSGGRTGLSDQVEMGQISELALDDSIAMRVRFTKGPPPPQTLYFRGPVLGTFTGRTWLPQRPLAPSGAPLDTPLEARPGAAPFSYQVTLEPQTIQSLPLLDGTVSVRPSPPFDEPQPRLRGRDWLLERPLQQRAQLDALALPVAQVLPSVETTQSLRDWLQLPAGYNPRTLDWALRTQRREGWSPERPAQTVQGLLTYIRAEDFRYTLTPRDAQAPTLHHIDRFWLDTRAGFCEHFATAFVVILRAMDIPARLVTGFQGAELNKVDGLLVVRNSDAHAWVEYWQAGTGWVRVDPTAAVAPERVDRARPNIRFPDEASRALIAVDNALWGTLRAYLDAGNHRWNLWVLSYSRQSQLDLLRRWGLKNPDTEDLIRLTAIIVAAVGLLGAAVMWSQRPPTRRKAAWHQPLSTIHAALLKAGYTAPANSPAPAPARSWAAWLQQQPAAGHEATLQQALVVALQAMDTLRYGQETAATSYEARTTLKTCLDLITKLDILRRSANKTAQK